MRMYRQLKDRGRWLLPFIAVLVLSPLAQGTTTGDDEGAFLQYAGDAARTGLVTGEGPDHLDLALHLKLTGSLYERFSPLIIGDHAYVLLREGTVRDNDEIPDPPQRTGSTGILHIDLTSGADTLIPLEYWTNGFASDGTHIYLTNNNTLIARALPDLEVAWELPLLPPEDSREERVHCRNPALRDTSLFLVCEVKPWATNPRHLNPTDLDVGVPTPGLNYALRVELSATPHVRWIWDYAETFEDRLEETQGSCPYVFGLALLWSHVIIQCSAAPAPDTLRESPESTTETPFIISLDAANGVYEWDHLSEGRDFTQSDFRSRDELIYLGNGGLTGTHSEVFFKHERLSALDAATGRVLSSLQFEPRRTPGATVDDYGSMALAFDGTTLYASESNTLYGLRHQPALEEIWSLTVPGSLHGLQHLLVDEDTLYGVTWDGGFFTVDLDSRQVDAPPALNVGEGVHTMAVGSGVAVLATGYGAPAVMVVGRTPFGIQPVASVDTAYPAPGETVQIDLTGTTAGAGIGGTSAALEVQVDWGDGTFVPWQPLTNLTHVYAEAGTHTARVEFRTVEGQWASETVTVHVGGTPPHTPGFLETAFFGDNQDMTWGIIGLFVAGSGAALAVAMARRRRHILIREMKAIDRAYDMTKEHPPEAERTLAERRSHIRGLLVDGKVTEAQFGLLERRVDQYATESRLSLLDGRLDYLPFGAVRAIQDMLQDGNVSAWERDNLIRSLEQERSLTSEQLREVTRLIDEWFAIDATRPPSPVRVVPKS